VFNAAVPRVMAGLDVTLQLLATPERIDELAGVGGPLATTLADLLRFFTGTYANRYEDLPGAAVHDPCAVLALTHPELFVRTPRHVAVETSGALTRGMTVIDRRTLLERLEPNTDVLEAVDAGAAWQVIVDAITRPASYGERP
jgi:inosine-uridine nucleoside N-ribohydrolase